MNRIDLIIVGAQKAGTTSLNNYLRSHPDLAGHPSVEFSFFTDLTEYAKGFESVFLKYFDKKEFKKIIAKNVTISQNEESLIKLKEHNPDMKIVFLMREPVSRAYSAYTMAVKDGWMQRSFDELKNIIEDKGFSDIMYRHFISLGLYARQLKTILKYFPSKNIRLYLFEDLRENPQPICDSIFNWMDLNNHLIQKKIYNLTVQPRSRRLTQIINLLRNKNNYFKKLAKTILPYSLFQKIGKYIINLNNSKKRFAPISDKLKHALLIYFENPNKELATLVKAGQLKNSLIVYKKNNWISHLDNDLFEK